MVTLLKKKPLSVLIIQNFGFLILLVVLLHYQILVNVKLTLILKISTVVVIKIVFGLDAKV